MSLTPLGDGEFAALMALFGPWGERHVAVAVSGGADSLALAWLAQRWGQVTALIVDHGLRRESATEAAGAAAVVESWGARPVVLRLDGLARGSAMAARARRARHAALQQACRDRGLPDLLLGHHAGDQAETLAMRQERGSGPCGLAGMAAVVEHTHARVLRPLLAIAPGRLRATLSAAGVTWADDPSNADVRTGRGRVRAALAQADDTGRAERAATAAACAAGRRRAAGDVLLAQALAACTIFPGGYALLPDAPMLPQALAVLFRAIAGADYAPPLRQLAALARAPHAATVGGCRVLPAGRLGRGWLVVREAAAMAPAAADVWDGRFRTHGLLGPAPLQCGRLAGNRHTLPTAVRQTLPKARDFSHTAYVANPSSPVHELPVMIEPACWPPAGAPFGAPECRRGCGAAVASPCCY